MNEVLITTPEGAELGTVEFFDAQGRQIRTIALQGRKAFVEVDLNGWSEGLYLARLIFEGHRVGETKFNVVK